MVYKTIIQKAQTFSSRVFLGLSCLFFATAASAEASRSLQSVDFTSLEGDRVLLTLTLSEPAPEPVVFTIDKPARLSLDLPDTRLELADRFRKIGVGKAVSLAAAEAKDRTRLVVELTELTQYSVRVDGNRVLLQLGSGVSAATVGPSVASNVSVAASKPEPKISNVDFRRGEKGEGRIVVTLVDVRTPVDVHEESGKVIAKFKGATLPDSLIRRLDVLDFATPVKYVDVRRDGVSSTIAITPVDKMAFEQVAYQTGNIFTLELQPLTQEKIEERKKLQPQYTGERISLSFQSVEIRSLLQIIADVAGTNMVVSDSVNGDIAMRLQNVPWDQALDIILKSKGLGMRRQGNVMMVAPVGEIASREKAELEAQNQAVQLAPLRSEIIQVNYAKASDLKSLITSDKSSLMSDRGRVSVDDRTNTLIVLETRDNITEIRNLVARLDIPVRQVLIESRIVIANDDYSKEVGARFGVQAVDVSNITGGSVVTSGNSAGVTHIVNGDPILVPSDFNVNLPAAGGAGIALAILGANYGIDLELSAMQTEGRGEVISTPRVITANGKKAIIEQGQEVPFQSSSANNGTNVQFKKAVLSLDVTPQITPDNRVLMDLEVKNDSIGQIIQGNPAIDTKRITTQVLIKTGETVVLGGVYQQTNSKNTSKVPLLGDIPLLGVLFRNDLNKASKRELLIFVTPKILQDGLKVN
ncbi:type IV pilus secretin PilQ [Stenotrophobium rhamnosiphilum]|uniref:Type IV pilus secretin PilQ n=1 Tax=Stenotrophobium rhamnosiphilum TaxID=2029166 RepID=A0A2T5MFB6_9GAMM|nr:type IV pilus secretin PilQ [Stenotrophobium rhamnosiphilum]PTU31273.1 type IV pilus secretin PilQ [Stenotrophobium rhamnosiphilum]